MLCNVYLHFLSIVRYVCIGDVGMASPHRPCYDGWASDDLEAFDRVWRVDFSVHFFTNGRVSCAILPVCTVDGKDVPSTCSSAASVEGLLTVVITSSPVRSNPSTRMLLECISSLNLHGGLAGCRKVIVCDGFKVRQRSQRKLGVVTDEEAMSYKAYVRRLAQHCRIREDFRRTRLVRLARRQGSAYAIREAIEAHVCTPFVMIVPHDCILARTVPLEEVVRAMHAHPDVIHYLKLLGRSTANYAEEVFGKCA